MGNLRDHHDFDLNLAMECASAYSTSSGLGCVVSDISGTILFEKGQGCAACKICEAAGFDKENCKSFQAYGMTEAERFGGRYIYFCPMGLTLFVSPIIGDTGSAAKITAGPFLMVEQDDYAAFDLEHRLGLGTDAISRVLELIGKLPYIPAGKVNALATLLFMAVGFMNKVSETNHMLDRQDSSDIQGQITEYIMELKTKDHASEYPFQTEKALLSSITGLDKQMAGQYLNELFGYILLSSGGNFAEIKSRIYELLGLISRSAVDVGAYPDEVFRLNHTFYQKAALTTNIDELCFLLTERMNQYIDSLFSLSSVKNIDVVSKAIHYMRRNFQRKIALDDVAKHVFLTPKYFSKVFKQETGQSFSTYLNWLRIEKSKQLLLGSGLKLVDIASFSGFEDQSYFTKVFKRMTGMSPGEYKRSGGRHAPEKTK